jgi:hypothetical protein
MRDKTQNTYIKRPPTGLSSLGLECPHGSERKSGEARSGLCCGRVTTCDNECAKLYSAGFKLPLSNIV